MSQTYFVKVGEDGDTHWYRDPEMKTLHRLVGPAVEGTDGYREWHQHDRLHRADGPAVETRDGTLHWFENGARHRLGSPAVESSDGRRFWYQNDQLHRLDGPAVEYPNGDVEYWIDGKNYTARSFKEEVKARLAPKEMTMAELEKVLGHPVKIIK